MADDKATNQDTTASASGAGASGAGGAGDPGAGARDTAERLRDSFGEHVTGPVMRAGETIRESGRKAVEGGATISMKLIDQAESNARNAFAAMRAAASAKDISEVMRIQSEYLREQSSRAMTQAREIGELIVEMGQEATSSLRPGDKR